MPPLRAPLSPVASPPWRSELLSSGTWANTQVVQGQFVQLHIHLVKSWASLDCTSNKPGLGLEWAQDEFLSRHDTEVAKLQINLGWFLSIRSIMGIFSLSLSFFPPFNFAFVLNFDTQSNTLSANSNEGQSSFTSASPSVKEVKC